jgi:hypothetical protein
MVRAMTDHWVQIDMSRVPASEGMRVMELAPEMESELAEKGSAFGSVSMDQLMARRTTFQNAAGEYPTRRSSPRMVGSAASRPRARCAIFAAWRNSLWKRRANRRDKPSSRGP